MLRFESIFWGTNNRDGLVQKLKSLGFDVKPSRRDPQSQSVFFGPEAMELVSINDKLVTLVDQGPREGVFAVGLESADIVSDYHRLQKLSDKAVGTPHGAKDATENIPLWFGFGLSPALTPGLLGWVVANSPAVLKRMSKETLPASHPNTCFGIEGIHLYCENPDTEGASWAKIAAKFSSGLQWSEGQKTQGRRLQTGDRFFDLLKLPGSGFKPGVFMVTIRVTDLEFAKEICTKAGANVEPCRSRDGFIVPGSFTGGPALRFVRSAWKAYLPAVSENFPKGRRRDQFRPLGGADTSTLTTGFKDDWTY